jgi:methionyl-tRNA formyltransferase
MLVEALDLWSAGGLEARFAEQDERGITYAEKIEAAERRIDPSQPAAREALRSRALTPHVGTWVGLAGGERLGVRARAAVADGPPRCSFAEGDGGLLLGCDPGALVIAEVQPPGGRWMAAGDYLRGRGLPDPAE